MLFDRSVLDNIALGLPSMPATELERVVEAGEAMGGWREAGGVSGWCARMLLDGPLRAINACRCRRRLSVSIVRAQSRLTRPLMQRPGWPTLTDLLPNLPRATVRASVLMASD